MGALLESFFRFLSRPQPRASRERYGGEIARTAADRVVNAWREGKRLRALALVGSESMGILVAAVSARFPRRKKIPRSTRSKRGDLAMEPVLSHLRVAARGFLRQPLFTGVAVATLALGIGASVAIFTVFHGVLLRPLPFREPGRLVAIWEKNPERDWYQAQVAPANYLDWRAAKSFTDMAAYNDWLEEKVLREDGEPAVVYASEVTGNLFDVLGVSPLLGRTFDDGDTWSTGEKVVLLSYGFWQSRFGGDAEVTDTSLELDGARYRIGGVLPEDFAFPFAGADMWLPVRWDPTYRSQVFFRRAHGLRVVGRLTDEATLDGARAELAAIAANLEKEYPETNRLMGNGVTPLREFVVGDTAQPLRILMAAVAFVLLIACGNVANLLLARGTSRQHELHLRSALGGARARLVAEGLLESFLLAGCGGALGLAIGVATVRPVLALSPEGLPRMGEIGVDGSVVLFAVGVTVLSALLFGAVPAWRGARAALTPGHRGSSRSRHSSRWTAVLVTAEVALTLPLVFGAALMVRTLSHLSSVEPGFVAEGVLVARVSLPADRYEDLALVERFYRELRERIDGLPGVSSSALSSRLPFVNQRWSSDFTAEGWPSDRYGVGVRHDEVTPGLFRTMDVPLLRGRDFDEGDRSDAANVVIVNEALAERYFPGEDPIGKQVAFDRVADASSVWRTIVGVVGNVRREALSTEEAPSFYAPVAQDRHRVMFLLVRGERDPMALLGDVKETVRELDPSVPLFEPTTLEAVVGASVARERFLLSILAAAAVIALLLATVGIFGVVLYATMRRVREIGIRMALGARSRAVVALVVGGGMRPVVAGIVLGLVAAGFCARALASLLFEVRPLDPVTLFAVAAVVLVAAFLACAVPARWATRVEARTALKTD